MGKELQVATLAGGCFWCLEAVFLQLDGVEAVVSGYTGGHVQDPSYQAVCGGETGHAEAVQVHFDPGVIGYAELLRVFFTIHDPTTLNRQGADVGPQYRSAIFHADEDQKRTAQQVIAELEAGRLWDSPLVTEIAPLGVFYPAEAYHQDYYNRNRFQPYCQMVIAPKLTRLRKETIARLKK